MLKKAAHEQLDETQFKTMGLVSLNESKLELIKRPKLIVLHNLERKGEDHQSFEAGP